MPRNRIRKTNIGLTSEEQMKNAIDLILDGNKIRKVAKSQNIPYTTLQRYLKKVTSSDGNTRLTPNYKVNKIFSDEQERSLVDYIIKCSQMFYGLTPADVRQLAYELAVINNIKVPQKWIDLQQAGIDWYYGLRKRHAVLSLRTPEGCSLSRATSFNKHNVKIFFDNLEAALMRFQCFGNGTRVFNLDETNTMTVQKSSKVLAVRGQKQVSKVTSGEKGTLVTTCYIINAQGYALPPVMIFPRVHFKQHMLNGAPTGTLGLASPSGWMNSSLFLKTMQHYIEHTQSSKDNPSLLIMDNYEAHICIEAINLAKENGVTILTVPPHSTGKLQPLDVGVFKPFKTAYNAAVDSWMMRNPGKTLSIYEVAQCVKEAHIRSMTPSNICSAFQATGIFPFNRDIFSDIDFAPSEVTNRDIPLPENEIPTRSPSPTILSELFIDEPAIVAPQQPSSPAPSTSGGTSGNSSTPAFETSKEASTTYYLEPATTTPPHEGAISIPKCDNRHEQKSEASASAQARSTKIADSGAKSFINPFNFRGLPKAAPRKTDRVPRRKGKSMIATDTPNKEEIDKRQQEKKQKQRKKENNRVKKKVLQSESSEDDNKPESKKKKLEKKPRQRQRNAKKDIYISDSDTSKEDSNLSLYSVEEEYGDEEETDEIDPDNFPALETTPREGNFVLVQFVAHKSKIFYTGKVLGTKNGTDFDISFLRKSQKVLNGYRLPDVPDIASVPLEDIKLILPSPTIGGTKRQQQIYKFNLDLCRLNLR